MSTQFPSAKTIERTWHVIDAKDQVLGRVASKAATLLMGKHKASYAPFLDTGDHVIIINAAQVRLTGRKEQQKVYRLPKTKLGKRMIRKLKVYAGDRHPHQAQKPVELKA